jgi:hypothetical protein
VPTTNTLLTLVIFSLSEYCSSFSIGFLPGFLIGEAVEVAEVALPDEVLFFAMLFLFYLKTCCDGKSEHLYFFTVCLFA